MVISRAVTKFAKPKAQFSERLGQPRIGVAEKVVLLNQNGSVLYEKVVLGWKTDFDIVIFLKEYDFFQ